MGHEGIAEALVLEPVDADEGYAVGEENSIS